MDDISDIEFLKQTFQDQYLIGNFFNENKISYDRAMRALAILFGTLLYEKRIDEEDLRVFHTQILGLCKLTKEESSQEIK